MSTGKAYTLHLAPTFTPAPAASVLPAIGKVVTAGLPVVGGIAAAAGAVFLTRAALNGLGVWTEQNAADGAAVAAERVEVAAWSRSFAQVGERDARIVRLEQQAAPHAGSLPAGWALPRRFVYTGASRDDIARWCRETDIVLTRAEQDLARLRIDAALARPTVSAGEAAVRQRIRDRLRPRPAVDAVTTPRPGPQPVRPPQHVGIDLRPVVDDLLAKAAGQVGADDFVDLAAAAAALLTPRGPHDPRDPVTDLDGFTLAVADARRRQEQRAADAAHAARWLVALTALERQAQLPRHQQRVLDALREVVAERRELDAALRAAAESLAAAAAQAAEDRAISEIVAHQLAALGYDVDLEQQGVGSGVQLTVGRAEWGPAHRASIEVGDGGLEAWFGDPGPELTRADLHLRTWAQDVRRVRAAAEQQGLRTGQLVVHGDPEPAVADPDRRPATVPIHRTRTTPIQMERPTPT